MYTDLEQVAWDLKTAQMEAGVDFPVHLSREAGGLVRSDTESLAGDSALILNFTIAYDSRKWIGIRRKQSSSMTARSLTHIKIGRAHV